jgi:hypothetical protein
MSESVIAAFLGPPGDLTGADPLLLFVSRCFCSLKS